MCECKLRRADRKLGITQEPIPYGKTGRVAIAGVTPALIQDANAAGYYSRSDGCWAMVRKHNDRWTLRLGPGGDARVITFLDSAVYQDGTYNDQVLALVDISTPPHRVDICNNSGSTLESCSTTITGNGRANAVNFGRADAFTSMSTLL